MCSIQLLVQWALSHQLVLVFNFFFFLIIIALVYRLYSKQASAVSICCPIYLNHFLETTCPEGQEGHSFQDSKWAN